MKKTKRVLGWFAAIVVVVFGIALVIPLSRHVLLGLVTRESFASGMPVRYWAEAMKDPNADTRRQAVGVISRFGPEAAMTVPTLIKILREDDELLVRINAAHALAKMGPAAKSAVPALIEALQEQNLMLRLKAAVALTNLGPDAKEAVPALIEAMKDEDNRISPLLMSINVRGQAAAALGRIGPDAKEAIPALIQALKADDPESPQAAACALGRMHAMEAIPALVEALRSKSGMLRLQATMSLANFGPDARAAVPALIGELKEQKDIDRFPQIAATTLGKIGPDSKAAIPDLIRALQGMDYAVVIAAAEALGNIGPDAKAAVPELIKKLKDQDTDFYLHRDAAESLKK